MLAAKISELWCTFMHDAPMWPIHGHYQCRSCGRLYNVPWTEAKQASAQPPMVGLKPALVHGRQ